MEVVAYEVPGWGVGELYRQDGRLVYHEQPSARPLDTRAGPVGAGQAQPVQDLVATIQAFFRGERVDFDGVALDLDWCTPFQRDVATALRRIPWGETVTYGELAALAGRPNAQRAAGTFCAGNRFPLILPCHRVVSAVGIGSYGSLGIEYKRRLLAIEGRDAL